MMIGCREILFLNSQDLKVLEKNPDKLTAFCGKINVFAVVIDKDTTKQQFQSSSIYPVVKTIIKNKIRLIIYLNKTRTK